MRILNLLAEGGTGGIEVLCNNIDKLSKIDNYWCFFNRGGEIAEEIMLRNPQRTYIFNRKKFGIKKSILEISNICKKEKIDIIVMHNNGLYCNMLFYYLKKKNSNVKFVRFLHSCYENKLSLNKNIILNKLFLYYFNKALQISDLIISVSNAVQKSHENKFDINDKNKVVIYNGISDIFINKKPIKTDKFKDKKCNIIYIGRLEKVKGVDLLIKSIKILKENKYDIYLTIIGDGSEINNLKKLAMQLNIENIVFFVGKKRNVIDWLDKSDIFVYPSTWEEAFGISVVESMSRGCIPITFKKGGLPEIIEDNINGFLVDEINSNNLANKIMEVIKKDYLEKQKISQNAIERSKKFIINNTIENLKINYDKLIINQKKNIK